MSPGKIWMKCARVILLLIPALALATPTFAQVRPAALSDSQEPGSVIVFPKFLMGVQLVDGVVLPATEIEVGIVCPKGATCTEHQAVKLRFHWVCPGFQTFEQKLICRENNFDVFGSVNGKVVFNPQNLTLTGDTVNNVAVPPCPMGYLIGWVINTADQPIKFDGLVGDGVIRESATAVATYSAIPIQADPALATGALIATVADALTGLPRLAFDGGPGHYLAATGTIIGDIKFDNPNPTAAFPSPSTSYLVLLTLDVRSDFPNFPTEVNINWWNESNAQAPTSQLFEKLLSTSWEFVCWTEVPISTLDPNLTQTQMGSRKGVFRSTNAAKFPWSGIFDIAGPVTLLGLVETMEAGSARSYFTAFSNDSTPVPTFFLPE
jgi:hypothetical protein